MKRIFAATLTVALVAILSVGALADSGEADLEQYIELLRSDIKTETVAVLTEVMNFNKEEGEAFWPIYREYEVERAAIGDQRLALLRDYAENFDAMTDMKAKELAKRSFDIRESRTKLDKKYYAKVEKATSSITAVKFMQVMNQINLLIDVQIASEVPLIERGQ